MDFFGRIFAAQPNFDDASLEPLVIQIKALLAIDMSLSNAEAVESANAMMGLPNEGTPEAQVNSLLSSLGVDPDAARAAGEALGTQAATEAAKAAAERAAARKEAEVKKAAEEEKVRQEAEAAAKDAAASLADQAKRRRGHHLPAPFGDGDVRVATRRALKVSPRLLRETPQRTASRRRRASEGATPSSTTRPRLQEAVPMDQRASAAEAALAASAMAKLTMNARWSA